MKRTLLPFFLIIVLNFGYAQTTYTFNGNGLWSDPLNWNNHLVPSQVIKNGDTVYINPSVGDTCKLDVSVAVQQNAIISIQPNANFVINGGLFISQNNCPLNSFVDARDGNVYHYKQIGSYQWMTEDLRYQTAGVVDTAGYYYYPYANPDFAPSGWHIATLSEWCDMFNYIGNSTSQCYAPAFLDTTFTKALISTFWGGTNSSCFSAIPTGSYYKYSPFDLNNNPPYLSDFGVFYRCWIGNFIPFGHVDISKEYTILGNSCDHCGGADKFYFSIRCVKD